MGKPGIPGNPGASGPAPDMTFYSRQLADVLSSSDKGPSGPSFIPDQFQYLQAQVGPVGARGPPGQLQIHLNKKNFTFFYSLPNFRSSRYISIKSVYEYS